MLVKSGMRLRSNLNNKQFKLDLVQGNIHFQSQFYLSYTLVLPKVFGE